MSMLQQLVQFLSQPPDSLIYHVIILLALQATFWLALYHLRRRPDDPFTRRLIWASAGMMLGRLIFLVAALAVSEVNEASSILPPLERAIDTTSAALLVWALAPEYKGATRLGDAILLIVLLLTGFIFIFFSSEWLASAESSGQQLNYINTSQAAAWDILQIIILGVGIVLIVLEKEDEWQLRITTIATLVVSHIFSLFSQSISPITSTQVAYWVRLGNLIAFPLLAILTYRYNISHILPSKGFGHSWLDHLDYLLQLSRSAISGQNLESTAERSLNMVTELIVADFWALATREGDGTLQIIGTATSFPEVDGRRETKNWQIELNDWPVFETALEKNEQIEFLSDGAGARLVLSFYQKLALDSVGPLLLTPLSANNEQIGMLFLSGSKYREHWTDADKKIAWSIADYLAMALKKVSSDQLSGRDEPEVIEEATIGSETSLISIQQDYDRARHQVSSLKGRVTALERQLASETSRAENLSDRLAASHFSAMASTIGDQEGEIAALKEALVQAEEAMAQAAASDAGVSAEWVVRTVTRYSGELEDAQARINILETQLRNSSEGNDYSQVLSRIRQLRSPLTSLGVYTNLLMSESLGELGSRQMSLVGRMRSNIEKMTAMVDRIKVSAAQVQADESTGQYVDIRETIESAIGAVGMQLRQKRLTLDLDIEEKLPDLPSNNGSLYEIITHLLDGTCRITHEDGRLTLIAHRESISDVENLPRPTSFLHIAVTGDNVITGPRLHSHLVSGGKLAPELNDDDFLKPAIESLSVALHLATAYGGRTWVEYKQNVGSTISVLLPEAVSGIVRSGITDVQ